MNTSTLPLLALALAAPAAALAITPGSTATVTLALTASMEAPGIKVTDPETKEVSYEFEKSTSKENADGEILSETLETKTIITPFRFGNAQLIAGLNEEDLLDGTVSGWSIVSVAIASDDESGDDSSTGPAIYAVKKGQTPVLIDLSVTEVASAEASSSKYTNNYATEKETYTGSGSGKRTITLSIADFNVQGLLTGTYKFVKGSLGRGEDAVSFETFLDGAQKVSAFSGTYLDTDVAEGSLSVGAAKIVDLETLGLSF